VTKIDAPPQPDDDLTIERRTPMTAARALATVLLALALAALLCASSIEKAAEGQDYGTTRDLALAFARPLRSVSEALFLDRPREWLASLTGHEDPPTSDLLVAKTPPVAPVTTTSLPPTSLPAVTTPESVPTPTVSTLPPRRVPTAEAPVRVWMGGDSLMGTVSEAFGRALAGDPRVSISTDIQVATGLSRPDVLDWATELSNQLDATQPEIVFLAFGGNDDQPVITPEGAYCGIYTPEWQVEYARRIGLMMDLASGGGTRTVVWLGLPSERPEQLNNMKDAINEAARSQAALRPDVHFVDLRPIYDAPDGTYTDEVVRPDGSTVLARARDGVHLSEYGADLLAPLLVDLVAIPWHLR
jgi:hypothetical protein